MRHGEGRIDTEAAQRHARADREAAQHVARISGHVGARLVVVAYAYMKSAVGHYLGCEYQMTHQIAAKRVLYLRRAAVGSVACLIIRQMPFGEVPGCHRKSHRQTGKRLRPAEPHVDRKPVVTLSETFHLSAEIGDDRLHRQPWP